MTEFAYSGKILRVDLSSGKITEIPTGHYADKFLGGRGIGAKIYWDEVPPETRAFDPENCLILSAGPLTGFPLSGAARWQICGKSPATTPEMFSYCNLGAEWGAHLKFSGYDAIVVKGKAERPVYLLIDSGIAKINDAGGIWGMGSAEARQSLKTEHGDSVKVVTCGPAGENLVRFANVIAENDASGSGGMGSIMGSKKLKAIAIRGNKKLSAGDPDKFSELCRYIREINKYPEMRGNPPFYRQAIAPYASKQKKDPCFGCIGNCNRRSYKASDGTQRKFCCVSAIFYSERARKYYGEVTEVPFLANKLCDSYGIDVNAISAIMIWLSMCRRAGILTDENTGIPVSKMGSMEFIETLVKKISLREGFGDILAHGVHEAASMVGKEAREILTDQVTIDGKYPEYCPRMYIVSGILYAMEPRLPFHQLHEIGSTTLFEWLNWYYNKEGSYLSTEVFRKTAKRFWGSELAADFSTYDGKALAAMMIQDRQCVKESLVLCDWMYPITSVRESEDHMGDPTIESKLLSAATGKTISEEELYKIGERIFNVQRAILAREGHSGREKDSIPEAFYTSPLKSATGNPECLAPGKDGEVISRKGDVVDREKFEKMKDEYYQLRGWDVATGLQTKSKLMELGLQEVIEDLEPRGLVV